MRALHRDLLLAAGSAAGFAAVTVALAAGGPLIDLDLRVHEWAAAHRPAAAEAVGRVLNRLGQGGWLLAICAVLAGWLGWRASFAADRSTAGPAAIERPSEAAHAAADCPVPVGSLAWRGPVPAPVASRQRLRQALGPLLYVATAAVLVVPTVLAVKRLTERGAPSSDLPPAQTVALLGPLPPGEYAAGYPGGHAVNTVIWYGVLLLLVTALLRAYGRPAPTRPLRLTVRLLPPVVVVLTTAYLSFHWLTDSLAGLLLGLAIDRLLAVLRARYWR